MRIAYIDRRTVAGTRRLALALALGLAVAGISQAKGLASGSGGTAPAPLAAEELDLARNSPDPEIRCSSLRLAVEIGQEETGDPLDPATELDRLRAHHNALLQVATQLLNDVEVEVRLAALETFDYLRLQPEELAPALGLPHSIISKVVTRDPDAEVRLAALELYALIGEASQVERTLQRALNDSDPLVREAAADLLVAL